jgi:putative acetyltransferase
LQTEQIIFRDIKQEDNASLANVIRRTMEEYKINKPKTVYYEPTTDRLFELFHFTPGSIYLVAEVNGEIIGGAGIFPTDQLTDGCCELVKLYLKKNARGKGTGRALVAKCLQRAKGLRYNKVYLESNHELTQAIRLYEKFGFKHLKSPLGNSGHTRTDVWMLKDLQ